MSRTVMRALSASLITIVAGWLLFAAGSPAAAGDPAPGSPKPPGSQGRVKVLYEGPFAIRNATTDKCIDIPGYGAGTVNGPVNQYTCEYTNLDNQLFVLDDLAFNGGYTNIQNSVDGLCLDLPGYGAVAAGTVVSEYYCDHTFNDNQRFLLMGRPDGHYWIYHYDTGLCLDVTGFSTGGNDARLTLWYCSDSDDHHWYFA